MEKMRGEKLVNGKKINSRLLASTRARDRAIAVVGETQSLHRSQRTRLDLERYYGFGIGSVDISEPVTYHELVSGDDATHWQDATDIEMQSMYDNQVLELVDLPPTGKAMGSKQIFKKKIDMKGNTQTFKERLLQPLYLEDQICLLSSCT
ncbi:hypothetical protein Tco_0242195 [Tanacetum coccineum]